MISAAFTRRSYALDRFHRQDETVEGLDLDTLSAGMSDDLEAAILEGATMVRIGTAIFGSRSASA